MRIVFFGDGRWATLCLKRLLNDDHKILAVVLRRQPSDSSLSKLAESIGCFTYQPDNVNDPDFVSLVAFLAPQLNISMSYDQIIHKPLMNTASLGFINCHAGKLPRYRGRNVINWAIINNEKEIGLTIHYVDEGIDTGDIILQETLPVCWDDTYGILLERITQRFPELLSEAVYLIGEDKAPRISQNHIQGSYFGKRMPGDEWLDWNDTSLNLYNKIRAITHPGPGARTLFEGRTLIVWQARYEPAWPKYIATPGEVVGRLDGKGVMVKTGDSILLLEKVQIEKGAECLPGFPVGTRLGVNFLQMIYELQKKLLR
ncbi:MAG: methionyl-tRNA formyltransferase [Peptococcaceae bacterium]|nr:MAG: methionyl-tRNA formyltransferase [Peptococcaceae bacterium]